MKLLSLIFFSIVHLFSFSQTWQQVGPEGGYFKEFTIHPALSNVIYAGSDDGGGIWKSIDNGTNWNLLTSDFPNMTGWKIVIDENSPDTLYSCDLYGRYGVLKSTDGGENWDLKNSGLNYAYDKMVSGLTIKTADTLFISTGESVTSTPARAGNGVYKSYDGGDNWIEGGLQGKTIPCIGKNDFGTIFAGSENFGLYYSNDNGTNWLTHPTIPTTGTIHEIQTISNIILVASSEGVFLSEDWGINFTNIGLAGEFNFDACIHTTGPNIEIYSSTLTGLKHYSNATSIWTTVVSPFFSDQIVIGITSDGTNVYCGGFSNSPIIKSIDGGNTWNETSTSPICTEINALYINPNDDTRMLAGLMGTYSLTGDYDRNSLYESTNSGVTWTRKGPDAHALCIAPNPLNSQAFYLGSFAQGVYKTTDNFETYTQLSPTGIIVNDIIISLEDTSTIVISEFDFTAPSTSISRSTDGGDNFVTVSNLTANKLLFNPNNNDTIYVATNNGLHISEDNGLTFSLWLLAGEDCRSLAFKNNRIYTGTTTGKLFKITNNVASDISGNWETPIEIKSILFDHDHTFIGLSGAEKDTFMVLQGSVWQSDNDGQTWNNITENMTTTNVYGNNTIVSNGSELFVATYGGGVFKSDGLNLSASIQESQKIERLSVYPNPSSESISIKLKGIDLSGFMVYDALGKDLSNQVIQSDNSKNILTIDISRLQNGIYTVVINTDKSNYVQFVKI